MARQSKGIVAQITKFARRILAKPLSELSRTGRIIQTLWDSAQLQAQERQLYEKVGRLALRAPKDSPNQGLGVERIQSKIDQIDRILLRQELLLKSYQKRGDIAEVLKEDTDRNKNRLDPV